MRLIHVCDGWEPTNGAANIARLLADEQRAAGAEVRLTRWASPRALRAADEVWVHCGWKPCLWWAALWARCARWVPEGCYDPVRLAYHGWKKRLVGPIERFCLRRCVELIATCADEREWIHAYLGADCPPVAVTDVTRFFDLSHAPARQPVHAPLRVLYLGRRHPLKDVASLEAAVRGLPVELRVVSTAVGEEKERVWAWADLLCLPTLSDNLGLVVAEALVRGKRVIVTDGAPAWRGNPSVMFISDYRSAPPATRVRLLREALLQQSEEK